MLADAKLEEMNICERRKFVQSMKTRDCPQYFTIISFSLVFENTSHMQNTTIYRTINLIIRLHE